MIKSETYQGMAGLNYIQDSELAFSTIYVVKREGTQHDKFVSGSNNRTYISDLSLGKIYFPTAFAPGGEKVFVIYKTGSGVEPEVPPGVCVPVGITATTLPDGIVDEPYSHTIYLTGTGPFVVTPSVTPGGMAISNSGSTVLLSGTPTTIQTENVQFSVSNCSGGSSVPFNQDFNVTSGTASITITNNTAPGIFITDVGGIPWTLYTGSFPLGYPSNIGGVHGAYTGVISVTISGMVFTYILKLYKNGGLVNAFPVNTNTTHNFSSQTFLSTDTIQIVLE